MRDESSAVADGGFFARSSDLRDDSLAGGQLLGSEEPRAAVAHRQERLTRDRCVKLEPEQDRLSLAKEGG